MNTPRRLSFVHFRALPRNIIHTLLDKLNFTSGTDFTEMAV